jgi:hypothetical protein
MQESTLEASPTRDDGLPRRPGGESGALKRESAGSVDRRVYQDIPMPAAKTPLCASYAFQHAVPVNQGAS